ncbi:hypothetical protein [Bifidobacterium cuniculi]|nr:hypothetical protein [Bifidobacterium cuniculi]
MVPDPGSVALDPSTGETSADPQPIARDGRDPATGAFLDELAE